MRLISFLFLLVSAAIFGCGEGNQDAQTAIAAPVDSGYVRDSTALTAVIDSLHTAFKAKSIDRMNLYFSEDGTFIGTDPNEFWTREQLNAYLTPSFSRDSTPSAYTVSKRAVEMSSDRKTAVVIDQFALPFSPNLPVRAIAFAEQQSGKWTIKMFSWSFIANNDDVNKLNDALK